MKLLESATRWLGRYREARIHLWQASALFSARGDKVGQADTHSGLIWAHQYQGRHKAALRHARQAHALYRAFGYRAGEANALSDIAWSYALLGEDGQALDPGEQALTYFRECGDPRGEAHALDNLGYAHNHLGHHQDAISRYPSKPLPYSEKSATATTKPLFSTTLATPSKPPEIHRRPTPTGSMP